MRYESYINNKIYPPDELQKVLPDLHWDDTYAEITLQSPFGAHFEIESHVSVDICLTKLTELFVDLYKIDNHINRNTDRYCIAIIEVWDSEFVLQYYGNTENTEFPMHMHKSGFDWFCTFLGCTKQNPAICIVDYTDWA